MADFLLHGSRQVHLSDSTTLLAVPDIGDATNKAMRVNVVTPVTVSGETIPADDFAKVQSTNSTDGSFPATIPTATEPVVSATRGVITWAGRENLLLMPFGTGADNSTFDIRVVGWQKISTLWIPTTLCQAACTLSTVVGVAGQTIVATERFADTIVLANGIGVSAGPVANTTGDYLLVGIDSYDYVEVLFDLGTATAANAVYNTF